MRNLVPRRAFSEQFHGLPVRTVEAKHMPDGTLFGYSCYELTPIPGNALSYEFRGSVGTVKEAKQWLSGKWPKALRAV